MVYGLRILKSLFCFCMFFVCLFLFCLSKKLFCFVLFFLKILMFHLQVFTANTDANSTVMIIFDDPIDTSVVQIQPLRGQGQCYFDWHCLLRLEILGCELIYN